MRPSFHKVAPLDAGPSGSFASTFLSDNEQNGPSECVFLPKDVLTQYFIKKESGKRKIWSLKCLSGENKTNKTSYIPVLNNDDETVAYIKCHKQGKGLVLLDREHHEAYVLCLPCGKSFVIYCRRPRTADHDMLSAVQHDGDQFYPWLKVSYLHETPIFHVWNGQSFEGPSNDPYYVVSRRLVHLDHAKSEEALLEICSGKKVQLLCSSSQGRNSKECNLQLAANADPAMMLTLLAVLAPEMVGI